MSPARPFVRIASTLQELETDARAAVALRREAPVDRQAANRALVALRRRRRKGKVEKIYQLGA
jgi:hypothetical protein